MNEKNRQRLTDNLIKIYQDCFSGSISDLACKIEKIIDDDNLDLSETFFAVDDFQPDNNIQSDMATYVFCEMLEYLDKNAANAQRVYEAFLEYDMLNLFAMLCGKFREFLSDIQFAKAVDKAKWAFDKEVVERYLNK